MTEFVLIRGTRYEVHECITCGVLYAVPETLIQRHRDYGGYHHCCNGHAQGWGEDSATVSKQRRQIERLTQQQARLEDEKSAAWATANEQLKQAEAARRETARLRKRIGNGVCPCCKRSFANVARHMQTKHPDNVVDLVRPKGRA